MRKLRTVIFVILMVCVVGTVVLLILSPDRVPVHYIAAGQADRIGSKYEQLLFPLITGAAAAAFLLLARHARRQGSAANEKIFLYAGVFVTALFTAMFLFFMWKAFRYDPAAARTGYDDITRLITAGMGILLILLGNMMPKVRRNSMMGLRTRWSMANDRVWQKSQRFGGIACVAAGFLIAALSLFIPGIWSVPAMLAVVVVTGLVCTLASRRYYLDDKEAHAQ